jgi:superfamily II DNA or RNA helicase
VSNATFAGEPFQAVVASFRGALLLVGDEVHNLGAPHLAERLPGEALLRLGLSATPRRWGDEEGTAEIERYFGPVCFTLDLGEAIAMGALTPYLYTPVLVTLSSEEEAEYLRLSAQIGRMASSADSENSAWNRLLFKRARLLGGAVNKLPALHTAIAPLRTDNHQLVYCSEASWRPDDEDAEEGAPTRQLEAVVQLLGARLRMRVAPYTSREAIADRRSSMESFARGSIQALVAIRCLDEGVDIPSIKRAFILASSQNPKQFIQRRGRVLRRSPGKDRAEIFDFIVVPSGGSLSTKEFEAERKIVQRELRRVVEFAKLADNGDVALSALTDLRMTYDLMDIGFAEEGT